MSSPDWPAIIAQLDGHVVTAALYDRAKHGFDRWFVSEGGVISGWTANEVVLKFHSHKLAFAHAMLPLYVETCFALYARDGQQIGTYRLITDLEGATIDDYVIFDVTGDVQ